MSERVKWLGADTPAVTFLALMAHDTYQRAVGATRLGIEGDRIKFRDREGAVVIAYPGDEIEVAPDGWTLHAASPPHRDTREEAP